MALFTIEDLTFAYPESREPTIRGLSLVVEPGTYVVVCGRTGCGKTTLLRHLKSEMTPTGKRSGRILFDGEPLEQVDPRQQAMRIGYVSQDPDAQIVTDTVWHELAFGLENLGFERSVMRNRLAETASYFGMQSWFRKKTTELSGGQKQLLNLAAVMVMRPDVLVLDEPTSQLDPIAANELLETIAGLNRELGTTVIIAEHDLDRVYCTADKVIVLDEGRLRRCGAPEEVALALHADADPMACALPAPARISFAVSPSEDSCPLTIREGGAWLRERIEAYPPVSRCISPGAPYCVPGKESVLSIEGVWFRYERELPDILRGISLSVRKGELFAIVGGNGVGKTTLLRAICGTLRPYRGRIRLLERTVGKGDQDAVSRGHVVMLPQEPQELFAKESVREELDEMLDESGWDATRREERIFEIASLLGIVALLDRYPLDLSGGEQQRVALAKIMMGSPEVLLLDEPTKGIDRFARTGLASVLKGLQASGVTMVMVSHDIEFCARYADTVAMFFDGEITCIDTSRRFFSDNAYYTTAASRMSRHVFSDAVLDEDVVALCEDVL